MTHDAVAEDGGSVELILRSFRFWRSVARQLAETADVVATRLRHRALDREILNFYAFDDPKRRDVAWWSQDFIAQADRYEILRDCLLSEIEDAREWTAAEVRRLKAEKAVGS